MSRGQAEHILNVVFPKMFSGIVTIIPHITMREKNKITQLINSTKQLCFVHASFVVTQIPDLSLHSKKSRTLPFPFLSSLFLTLYAGLGNLGDCSESLKKPR